MAANVTLGLRSSAGRKRIQVPSSASGSSLRNAIQRELGLEEDFHVRRDRNGKPGDEIKLTRAATVTGLRLKHGDVLYITPVAGTRFKSNEDEDDAITAAAAAAAPAPDGSLSSVSSSASLAAMAVAVQEDAVDVTLRGRDGRIEQPRSAHCRHKEKQKCVYCASLEPFDEEYLKREGVKHMSFHAYIRKLSSGIDRGKYAALEDISCKIKPGCTGHKPWPAGICSKCQPPAITLNRQKYRHVDLVSFENAHVVDNFLAYWRATGNQRIGFLYGRFEATEDVPLGIKAVVASVYEPPQECTRDSVALIQDDKEEVVEALAKALGLQRIGWVFTDLLQDAEGKVRHFRNIDTHFMSSQECITAGYFQSKYPNACRLSSSGYFGSRFATVLVTGNADHAVHMEGYQVSNQCMALVRDDCLVPTKDAPELGFVRESSSEQYVPDVFYKQRDEYGNEVTRVARPLPVEYLLVDVPVSTPLDPVYTFHSGSPPFPRENRPMEGHLQDFAALAKYRKQFPPGAIYNFFRDFHLLLFLAVQTIHPMPLEVLMPLLEAIRDGKEDAVVAWSKSEHWQTLELLLEHSDGFH